MTPPPKKSKSLVTKRSIYIGSRKSSVHVEDLFWAALWEIANTEGVKLTKLLTSIDGDRYTPNLSSAIRLYVLAYYMTLAKQKTAK